MISKEYIAGVMDSDGSFSLVRRKYHNPRGYLYRIAIQIAWKNSDEAFNALTEIQSLYGGNVCTYTRKSTNVSPKPNTMLKYMCESDNAVRFASEILPYLQLKKRQAAMIIELGLIKKKWLNGRKAAPNKPNNIWDEEDKIYAEFISLNTKNGGKGRSK